jgi:polyisoprenyl-phosphate glycosyltransferase
MSSEPKPDAPDASAIIVPALNEAKGIAFTLDEISGVFRDHEAPPEVIVVDDGSTDDTAKIARAHGARVVQHPHQLGYGAALKTGIRSTEAEAIAIIDADGTYPAEAMPALFEDLKTYDMVVGQRTGKHYRKTALRSPLRTAFLALCRYVVGSPIPDPNSGLRVFRRSAIMPYMNSLPRAFSFTTTISLVLMLRGHFVLFTPIDYRERIGRRKIHLLRDTLRVLQTLVEIIVLYNPIKLFSLLCMAALAPILVIPFLGLQSAVTWGLLVLCLSTSIIVFSLGLVAYTASKNK